MHGPTLSIFFFFCLFPFSCGKWTLLELCPHSCILWALLSSYLAGSVGQLRGRCPDACFRSVLKSPQLTFFCFFIINGKPQTSPQSITQISIESSRLFFVNQAPRICDKKGIQFTVKQRLIIVSDKKKNIYLYILCFYLFNQIFFYFFYIYLFYLKN